MSLAEESREGSYFKKNEELLVRLSQKETLLEMSISLILVKKEFKRGVWKGKQG